MIDFGRWTDGNWYALGSLLIQLGFLVAAAWFARGLLRTVRGFQEQLGALLKLNITADSGERQPQSVAAQPAAESSPYWLAPSEPQTSSPSLLAETGPGRLATAWHGLTLWLNTPMTRSETTPWRRMITWLQTPAGT